LRAKGGGDQVFGAAPGAQASAQRVERIARGGVALASVGFPVQRVAFDVADELVYGQRVGCGGVFAAEVDLVQVAAAVDRPLTSSAKKLSTNTFSQSIFDCAILSPILLSNCNSHADLVF